MKRHRTYKRCDVCGEKHQYIRRVKIKYQGKTIEVDEIHSPCLDEIARRAVGALNKLI